jgi:hypothetical protein
LVTSPATDGAGKAVSAVRVTLVTLVGVRPAIAPRFDQKMPPAFWAITGGIF